LNCRFSFSVIARAVTGKPFHWETGLQHKTGVAQTRFVLEHNKLDFYLSPWRAVPMLYRSTHPQPPPVALGVLQYDQYGVVAKPTHGCALAGVYNGFDL
jgi:hypothetical protein